MPRSFNTLRRLLVAAFATAVLFGVQSYNTPPPFINPQPLPPADSLSEVSINPQPLPPGGAQHTVTMPL